MSPGTPGVAVVLLSGGLDSATVLAMARARGLDCVCLSFDYAQRHRVELEAARGVAQSMDAAEHIIFPLDTRIFAGSALTSGPAPEKHVSPGRIGARVPSTYVPARNLVMLSVGVALAESRGAGEVHIGVNALDYSGYPDCRLAFLEAFRKAAALGTRVGVEEARSSGGPVRIVAPLLELTKAQIICAGVELGVDYGLTTSCYDPDASGGSCGSCEACILRRRGFADAGVEDPTRYQHAGRR